MKEIYINKNNLCLFIMLILSIFPIINIAGFGMPILYLLIPIQLLIIFQIIFGKRKAPSISKYIILNFTLIIIEILISTFYGTVDNLNKFVFPTDIIQYIARMCIFVFFVDFLYKQKVTSEKFIRYTLIVFNIGMLIGFLQWIKWPGRELLVRLYPFKDGVAQLEHLSRNLSGIRIHGIAQHATANGGLAVFFFIFGYGIYRYYGRHKKLSIFLMGLCLINIFASQSRGGQMTLVFALILMYFMDIYITRKSIKNTVYIIIIIILGFTIFKFMYENGNSIIEKAVYRWQVLFETNGGNRVEQAYYFLNDIRSIPDFIFGLSKQIVNLSSYSYGVEIEPINIFITYGILGFLLHFILIISLIIYIFKRIRKCIGNKDCLALMVISFIGLASYQVFSVCHYFFREIRIGLFPWIIIGATIGLYESKIKNIVSKRREE